MIQFHACSLGGLGRVDRDAGIIRGAAVITGGVTAKGHNLEVDDTLLDQIVECGNAKGRVQVKLNHKDPHALQSICGFVMGFRREGNKVVADWHLLKTHEEYPRIMERAERMPECFGLSCAFRGPEKGQKGTGGKMCARCEELISVDCVTAPAANPSGLFSRGSDAREGLPALRILADRARRLAHRMEFEQKKRERELPASLKAGASAAVSGAALGLIPAFRRGSSLKAVARSVGIGAAAGAAVGGGGTAIGGAILGKPREDEGGAITKRAALGGGIAGALGGATAGALALRTRLGRRLLVKASRDWRPALWARRAGLPGAVAIGATGGGIVGAAHAADEGQQVDTLNSLKKDKRKRQNFSAYIEDVTLMSLPAETRKTIEKLVTAKKSAQFVQYGMTVRELLAKADPFNLKNARAHVRSLSPTSCMGEVQRRLGEKFILLLNDRIIDGHHFLAKAERAQATNALMVLDLTPARFQLAVAGSNLEFVDPRPRDNFGQFAPAAAGGVDPNSMAAAYGGVLPEKARRQDFLARVMKARRRVFGNVVPEAQPAPSAVGAISTTVPRIERSSEFLKTKSGWRKAGSLLERKEQLHRAQTHLFAARILRREINY